MGWGKQKGKNGGTPCPTTNMHERALLEFYRMGLASGGGKAVGGSGGHGKGGGKGSKGAGKQDDKSGGKGAGPCEDRCCKRENCRAAEKKQATWGGAHNCHVCGLSLTAIVPVQQLCSWAYEQRLAEVREAANKAVPKAAAKAKAAPTAATKAAQLTKEQIEGRRAERLAELKAAAEAQPAAVTPTQEVAKVFADDGDKNAQFVVLEADLVKNTGEITKEAEKVVKSLQAEHFPSKKPLQTVDEVLTKLLQGVSSCASVDTKEAEEKALSATTQAITSLRAGGVPDTDPDLAQLIKRQTRQQKEVSRLTDRAPTKSLRKLALVELKDGYSRQLQADSDFAKKGREKAAVRAQERLQALEEMYGTILALRTAAVQLCKELNEEHDARTAAKADLGAEVLDHLDLKIDNLDVSILQAPDETGDDAMFSEPEELTVTEEERDRLKLQLAQLQGSTTTTEAEAGSELEKAQAEIARLKAAPSKELAKAKAEIQRLKSTLKEAEVALLPAGTDSDTGDLSGEQTPAWDPTHDLWLQFNAEPTLLPKVADPIPKDVETALDSLAALFTAVPWGQALPALTFDQLGVQPHMVHSLLGTAMWEQCWGERQARVNGKNYVPYKMTNILKWLTEQAQLHLENTTLQMGQDRYHAAEREATKRREGGTPY